MGGIWESPSGGNAVEVDPTHKALRASLRPYEGRHYRMCAQSAVTSFQGNFVFAALRWADTSSVCLIHHLYAVLTTTTASGGVLFPLQVLLARPYTAIDSTNATVVTSSGVQQSVRSNQSEPGKLSIAVSNGGSAGVSGGTRTSDGQIAWGVPPPSFTAALGTACNIDLFKNDALNGHPLVLAANEGLFIQPFQTAGITFTGTIGIGATWSEAQGF